MIENERKKKIAIVNVFFPPQSIGGATRVVSDNIDILHRDYGDRFEIVVFTTDATESEPHHLKVYAYKGIRVYRVSVLWRVNMDWHDRDSRMAVLFDEFLAFEQPDLIHFHCIQRLTASIVEATLTRKIPYYVTVHDAWWISDYQFLVDVQGNVHPDGHADLYALLPLPQGISFHQSIKRRIFLKELLLQAKKVFAVSENFAALYFNNGIVNVTTNKNGISDSIDWLEKDTSYTRNIVCAHIGGMSEHKGYFLFKEAIEATKPQNIEVLAIDHSKDEDYSEKTDWNGVPVTIQGRISQDNIVDLYKKIDVLFAPSIWPESYGLVTREAAACGCWVVASEIGGIAEDINHEINGLRIQPNSLEALKLSINWIVDRYDKVKAPVQNPDLRLSSQQVQELSHFYSN
ncbi:MAG: glycosyltransferase family 4 protein [Methylococcaceae bacterium]|nr:glycosyltransferase family 4 protein [Methylococcaceae bacterium]